MLDEKFIEAIGGLGALSALLLVVMLLAGLLWAVLRWMKERETEQGEHIRVMMASYQNLNNANEAMIKRIEQAAKMDQEYAEKIERQMRDERAERQAEIALLKGELADLQIKHNNLALEHQQSLKEIALLRAEVAAKQAALDELEGKLQAIQKQRDSLKKELTLVQTQNSVMAEQISRLQDERECPEPEPPAPVKTAPRPRLVTKGQDVEEEAKDEADVEDVA